MALQPNSPLHRLHGLVSRVRGLVLPEVAVLREAPEKLTASALVDGLRHGADEVRPAHLLEVALVRPVRGEAPRHRLVLRDGLGICDARNRGLADPGRPAENFSCSGHCSKRWRGEDRG
eukprot:812396-Alexandrium_andersonii.AAC.1